MPATVNKLIEIKEGELLEKIVSFKEIDEADIVTAYADGKGTYTVESTIIVADALSVLPGTSITLEGKMSVFGGPEDTGVTPDEGLALFSDADVGTRTDLFLPQQPPESTGVARRLDPDAHYVACRWDYGVTPKFFCAGSRFASPIPPTARSPMRNLWILDQVPRPAASRTCLPDWQKRLD